MALIVHNPPDGEFERFGSCQSRAYGGKSNHISETQTTHDQPKNQYLIFFLNTKLFSLGVRRSQLFVLLILNFIPSTPNVGKTQVTNNTKGYSWQRPEVKSTGARHAWCRNSSTSKRWLWWVQVHNVGSQSNENRKERLWRSNTWWHPTRKSWQIAPLLSRSRNLKPYASLCCIPPWTKGCNKEKLYKRFNTMRSSSWFWGIPLRRFHCRHRGRPRRSSLGSLRRSCSRPVPLQRA